jgi:tryptophanyl-tRNA synthetase
LREAVGLRPMRALATSGTQAATTKTTAHLPSFKQYREGDGRFYFKLQAADGQLLLQSQGFDEGRAAGAWVKRLKTEGAAALAEAPVTCPAEVSAEQLAQALADLVAAQD